MAFFLNVLVGAIFVVTVAATAISFGGESANSKN
jgi:hypothetical protein